MTVSILISSLMVNLHSVPQVGVTVNLLKPVNKVRCINGNRLEGTTCGSTGPLIDSRLEIHNLQILHLWRLLGPRSNKPD